MKKKSLDRVLSRYRGGWVSVAADYTRVLTHGKTLQSVLTKLARLGNPKGILMHVAKDYSRYAGIIHHNAD